LRIIGRAGWDFEQETPAKNSKMEPRVEDWFKKHFKLKKKIERKSIYSQRQTPPKTRKKHFPQEKPQNSPQENRQNKTNIREFAK
jgi:hypothetical protein